MKVNIKDYQIIKDINLEFKPGFTVITGPSNNGKSSILKAIKAALYTETGATPIRRGSKLYEVSIDNHKNKVIFTKKESTSSYKVNDETFAKFGVNTPKEVSEALNIKELVLSGQKTQLNFWNQMDKPFLLDKSAGELFKFIVDSGETDNLSQMIKAMVSDRQALNKEADLLQGSINATESMINSYEQELSELLIIKSKSENLINLKLDFDKVTDTNSKIELYKSIITSLKIEISRLKQLQAQELKFELISNLKLKSESTEEINTHINYTLPEYEHKHKLISDSIVNLNSTLGVLSKIDTSKLASVTNLLERYSIILNNIKQVPKPILVPLDNTKMEDLQVEVLRINNIINESYDLDSKISKTYEVINNLDLEKTSILNIENIMDFCPLCGNKIKGE